MQSARTKAEIQIHKNKLAASYAELQTEFSSTDLRHVGNYTLDKFIGKGSFGKVYLARHGLTNGSKVVLKASKKDDHNLVREIHHHRQFIHPHIARLYEVIVTEQLVWLVLEWCPGDELYHYLLRTGALPVEKVQKIFTQLVGAVAYIHSKSCVHRDLKLENVLLDKNENVKLCDFGFTREYEGKTNYLQTFCGTVCYSAPEMLKGEKYAGEKVDVWSLGIILYALLRGALPFDEDNDQATKARILQEEPEYPESFPDVAKALITKLLSKRPLHRPTIADILADPFLAEFAPAQQAILKLAQPAPFSTALEKAALERMRSAGVDIDKVIENVLSQRCDSLAGWWALLTEKEYKKEARRERKRKEKESEIKLLRRLSAASSRLDKLTTPLEDVPEDGSGHSTSQAGTGSIARKRSLSRGRSQRRSTPQILITDLPKLPEGAAVGSASDQTAAENTSAPIVDGNRALDADNHAKTAARPQLLAKERRRQSSTLQLVTSNPDLLSSLNGVNKRRSKGRRNNFFQSLAHLKHWFEGKAKVARSPKRAPVGGPTSKDEVTPDALRVTGHNRDASGASAASQSTSGARVTPVTSQTPQIRLDTTRVRPRSSISPNTPRAAYRHSSGGLRGRKSTSSSVSSVRSIHHHSKASSVSSNSQSLDIIHSPARSIGRSPHSSVKVLPATPTSAHFAINARPSSGRFGHESENEEGKGTAVRLPLSDEVPGQQSVLFARRKKSPFKGPSLNSALFSGLVPAAQGSPAVRPRETSASHINLALRDLNRNSRTTAKQRKSQIIEEEEENNDGEPPEEDEDDVEEVDDFGPVDLRRGERVHSIVIWDDGGLPIGQHEVAGAPEIHSAVDSAVDSPDLSEVHGSPLDVSVRADPSTNTATTPTPPMAAPKTPTTVPAVPVDVTH